MLASIRRAIACHDLILPGSRILVAVSGGADSIALLTAMRRLAPSLRLRLHVAHLNHGIRGAPAHRDAEFVKRACRGLGIPCTAGKACVPRLAKARGWSIEMAARHARYRFLSRTARVVRADAIATAHTADDQAETVLLRLTRGAGTQGLAGIPWVGEQHGVRIVRPMLGVTRAEVVAFLRRSNMEWREDETNCDTFCRRNLVRAEVIPLIEKRINPRVRDALRRTADIVRAEDDWMQALARTALARWRLPDRSLDAAGLRRMPVAAARRVVRLWLTDAGVPVEHVDYSLVERVIELARTGGSIPVGPDLRVASRKKRIIAERITPATEHAFSPSKLRTPGVTMPPGAGFRITAALAPGVIKDRAARVGVLPARASLNGDVLGRRSLSVRAWRAGDRILPMGMQGSRKLQDVFVDAKFPPSRRRSWPLVLCGREVVWVPGYRVARGWEVLPGTRRIIRLIVEELRGHRVR